MIQHNKHAAIQYASVIVLALTISFMLIACSEESKPQQENETIINVTEDVIMATDGPIVGLILNGSYIIGTFYFSQINHATQ